MAGKGEKDTDPFGAQVANLNRDIMLRAPAVHTTIMDGCREAILPKLRVSAAAQGSFRSDAAPFSSAWDDAGKAECS
ncbi:unnamed protein product [Lampetra fluviatilis]